MDNNEHVIAERIARFQNTYESKIRRRPVNCSCLTGDDPEEIRRTLHNAGLDNERCAYACCHDFEELAREFGLKGTPTVRQVAPVAELQTRITTLLKDLGVVLPERLLSEDDELWLARLAGIEIVLRLAKIGKQHIGNNSLIPMRKLPRDGSPCKLKRHFKGCLRQVIGFAELMASRDPERFIWVNDAFFRHARKWSGGYYSRRQVQRALSQAEQVGILGPAQRVRHGVRLQGFLVHDHDDISYREDGYCILPLRQHGYAIRRKGQKRSTFSVMTEVLPHSSVSSDVASHMSTGSI